MRKVLIVSDIYFFSFPKFSYFLNMNMESAIICDKILQKFVGNETLTMEFIHTPEFYQSVHPDYFVVENHINKLLGDGALLENTIDQVWLSKRGLFMMTNHATDGYVAMQKANESGIRREKGTYKWAVAAAIVSIFALLAWLLEKFSFI